MKGLIKLQRIFLLTTLCLMLINSISALTTYAEFSDGSKIKTLEDGASVDFEVYFFSMNPAMDLVIELRDSLDNLVYTFLTTRTDLKTYTGTYSLNRTNYGGLGSYSIIAIGKDSVDSLQYDQLNVNIIDTTPPIGIISYPLDSTTYTSNISKLEFTATDINLAKCEYSTDNGVTKNVVACTSGVLTTIALNSTEGVNKWDIYLTDSSGNIFNSAVNFIVNSSIPPTPPIDSTPPLINILGPVNGTTYTSNVSFLNFIATDINLAKCGYSTDNGITKNVVACTSGVLTTIALNSTEGVNKWIVYAEDNAGNTNSNYTEFIVNSSLVDITPPVINVISPENNKEYKTKEITLKLITDENARVLFSLDNKANITMNNPNDHIFTYELSLSDKAHELIFYAIDNAGNVASKKINFVVDYKKNKKKDDTVYDNGIKVIDATSLDTKETTTFNEIKDNYDKDTGSGIIYLSGQKAQTSFFEGIGNFFNDFWQTIVNFFKKIFGLK